MPSDLDRLNYALSWLRRNQTLDQLKALSNKVAETILTGKNVVVITSSNFEGGSGSGQVTFEAVLTGQACEQLIAELDPTAPKAPARRLGFVVLQC